MPPFQPGIVTLTTDFGTQDSYVGAMRGMILCANPAARLVDLSHDVPPRAVARAAAILVEACPCYPKGTVHLVVVDPGVGTERAALIATSGGHWFVGPDNGVLHPVLSQLGDVRCWRIDAKRVAEGSLSATFHGRDLFGPVAGALSAGLSPDDLGEPMDGLETTFSEPQPQRFGSAIRGEVSWVDHFGNLISNIGADLLPAERPRVEVEGREVDAFVRTYGEAPSGAKVVALIGSNGRLEVAAPNGNAARELGLGPGARIVVSA